MVDASSQASDKKNVEIDPVSGIATTQHSWDGIQELNNPLPRWWLWLFILTVVWSIGYWIAYPAWPLVTNYSKGLLNWASRTQVADELNVLRQVRAKSTAQLEGKSTSEIRSSPPLMALALAQGRVAFADNCAPCHGQGGGGAKG